MIKQIKNYFYERFTDFTISPPNFLPMIVTTRDKATQLMEGKLEMPPMRKSGESIPYCRRRNLSQKDI